MNKNFLIFFFLILSLTSFSVMGSTVFSENFDYNTTFASNGWTYGAGAVHFDKQDRPLYNHSFGINQTNVYGMGAQRYIFRNFSNTSMLSGIMELSFTHQNNDTLGPEGEQGLLIYLSEYAAQGSVINTSYTIVIQKDGNFVLTPSPTKVSGGSECTISTTIGTVNTYKIHFDFPKGTYYVLYNGNLFCEDYSTGFPKIGIRGILLLNAWSQYSFYQEITDDLLITDATSSYGNTSAVGKPCSINSDCQSQNCVAGTCMLKSGGMSCSDDVECLSYECYDNKCTNSGVWSEIDQLVSTSVAPDENSKFFIVLVIMLLTVGLVVWAFHAFVKLALVLSGILIVLELFFFTIVGWVSAWILILGIIVGIIGAIILIFLKSSGS